MERKRILILDDNEDILDIVREVLQYENFEVKAISEAKHVMAIAGDFQPDLFLLDYKLQDGNGAELCQHFKAQPQFAQVPVIIFSAYTHPDMDFKRYGCDGVIAKPFDLDVLTATLQSHLHRSEN